MADHIPVLVVVAAAVLPPLLYLVYVRNAEKKDREPWGRVLWVFMYGGLVSVAFALILSLLFDTGYTRVYEQEFQVPRLLFLAVVVAPVVEEFTKGLGVRQARGKINELEDGIVYGVAAGLGFSATENILYEAVALAEHGTAAFIGTAILRALSSSLLHATASGLVGYGMARRYLTGGYLIEVAPYYALAVLLHGLFNFVAGLTLAVGAGFLVIMSFLGLRWTTQRIRTLDQTSTTMPRGFRPLP